MRGRAGAVLLAAAAAVAVVPGCAGVGTEMFQTMMGMIERPMVGDDGLSICEEGPECAMLHEFACSSLDGPNCAALHRFVCSRHPRASSFFSLSPGTLTHTPQQKRRTTTGQGRLTWRTSWATS